MISTIVYLCLLLGFSGLAKCTRTTLAIKQDIRDYNHSVARIANTFLDLIQRSKIFVDNTMLIRDLIEMSPHPQTILWQGAHNWGKTMNMEMIKMFFEMKFDKNGDQIPKQSTQNYKFFAKGEITLGDGTVQKLQTPLLIAGEKDASGSSYLEHMGRYPVIYVNFKNVNWWNLEIRRQQFQFALSRSFLSHMFLVNKTRSRRTFTEYLKDHDWKNIGYSIRYLCEELSTYINRSKSVIILIDEFDTPILNLFRSTHVPDITPEGIREIFTALKDLFKHTMNYQPGKSCMYRTILTSRFKLENHSYGKEFYLMDKDESLDEYFGFREEHVRWLMEKYGIVGDHAQEALRLYGTEYSAISKQRFYNPHSMAKFFQLKTFETDWYDNTMFMLGKMLHVKDTKEHHPWFLTAENFLFTLLTNHSIDIKNARILPFEYVNRLIKLRNRLRNKKMSGYDDTHPNNIDHTYYQDICLSFLLANGYLTQISNTNQTKLLNVEMATPLGNFVDSFYSKYCPRQEQIVAMVPMLAKFLESNLDTTSTLEKALKEVHTGEVCDSDHFYLMRAYTLRILLRFKFSIDIHYKKIPTCDLIMINTKNQQAVVLKLFQHDEGNIISPQMTEHKTVLEHFPSLRTIKLISINTAKNQSTQISIKIVSS